MTSFFDSDQIKQGNYKFRNIPNKKNKLTRLQLYPETELACQYNKTLYKTQNSDILVEYESGFDTSTGKLIIHQMATSHSYTDEISYVSVKFQKNAGGKVKPQDWNKQPLKLQSRYKK